MKMKYIPTLLLLLAPVLAACQGEEVNPVEPPMPDKPKRVFTVTASLPGSVESRTHITYGNPDPNGEIFQWHPISGNSDSYDYITVFNITQLAEFHYGIALNATKVDDSGSTAEFESVALEDDSDFQIKAGDLLFVNYWAAEIDNTTADGGGFSIDLGQKPQLIVANPTAPAYMTYMQGNLKMYDIVTAVEDNKIPDIHFKYLSAIMRVTLRNETSEDFWPKSLTVETSGEAPFFPGTMFFSIDPKAADGSGLKVYNYDRPEGTNESTAANPYYYTNTVSVDINNYTAAATEKGTFIAPGESYDLYMSVVPRINNSIESKSLTISLEDRDKSDSSRLFKMTLNDFNTVIKAGKRYWFNLTAVVEKGECKLVFTNQWQKEHPGQNTENGE